MKSVEGAYERWCVAFGQKLTRLSYFDQLLRLEETGAAVKDVIVYVQRKIT